MKGLTVYSKQRPVDILYYVLENSHGYLETKKKEFKEFIDRFGHAESCAMCLSIVDAISSLTNTSEREKGKFIESTGRGVFLSCIYINSFFKKRGPLFCD
jgi:hypothetical protein